MLWRKMTEKYCCWHGVSCQDFPWSGSPSLLHGCVPYQRQCVPWRTQSLCALSTPVCPMEDPKLLSSEPLFPTHATERLSKYDEHTVQTSFWFLLKCHLTESSSLRSLYTLTVLLSLPWLIVFSICFYMSCMFFFLSLH